MKWLLLFITVWLASCETTVSDSPPPTLTGYAPVYASATDLTAINVAAPRATTRPGKIYAYGAYAFQVEQGTGIHIIDNHNPRQAQKIGFLNVPLASELAIKAGNLYTNNGSDLVVFDISNVAAPKLVNRVTDAFPIVNQEYPPVPGVYFECVDAAKGVVIGWEQRELTNPKCRR